MSREKLQEEYETERLLAVKRSRLGLLAFTRHINPVFHINWHHRVICDAIDQMVFGKERRVIISAPPRHGKSELVSRHLPGFILGHRPVSNIIACSYAADLAKRMNRDAQRIIDCDVYREVFPNTRLNSKNVRTVAQTSYLRNSDIFEVVEYKGAYRAAGVGGGITGMGADWLILDDLVANAEQGGSQTILDAQWEWYTSTARTRLAKDGRILIVMTRWADGDIPGRLIELMKASPEADQWKVINLPAINEHGPTDIDPRQSGEALWPFMFPLKTLLPIKATSERVWQSLYQCDPVPPGGNIVQNSWWRRWTEAELPLRYDQMMIACDLTFKDGAKSDWTVMAVLAKKNGRVYLLDQVRRKMDFLAQMDALLALRQKWIDLGHHVREVAVEAAANGEALVNTLRSHIPNIVAVPTGRSSKLARAEAQTPIIQAGNFLIPTEKERPWVAEYTIEWQRFPHGKNDDQVDASVLGLARMFPLKSAIKTALPLSMPKRVRSFPYQ